MLFFHQNNQFEAKTACFADFSILTKIAVSGPYRRGHFSVDFLKCWKYPSNSSETFKMLFFHQNNQFEAKTACFADFSILTKIAVSGPYRRGHFSVDFLKCWKYPSNSSETFKMLFFHQNNQFEAKTACFADFSILTKIAVSGPYRRGHFFRLIFWNVENTLPILLKHSKCCSFIKTISLKQKQHVLLTFQFWPKSLYPDLTGVAILLVDFFGWFFEMLKIPFQFFWNIQNVVLSSKQSVWSKNSMFCGLFNFDQNRCIRTLPAWPFFWLIFWNVENTLPILLKHSKCCSFIKTISLKQKQHVLRTFQFWPKSLYPDLTGVAIFLVDFLKCWKYPSNSSETFKMLFFHQNNQHVLRNFQFWPKSLYPDLTGVAILLVDFFGWFFEMLKIPFQFFWNIQNVVLSSKQSACFAEFSILTKIAVSGPYRRGHFVGWFFWLSFSNVENTLRILLKHSKFCSFIKTISLKQKQHVLRTFQFWPKSLYPDLTGVAIFRLIFWNVENTLPILLKHSKCCSFIKTIRLKQKQHVLLTFQFWPKSLYPDLTGVAILFGWFFFEMLKIPFQFFWNIQNVVLSSKQSDWSKNSMFCWLFNFDQNRCIRTLPAWPFCWLIFLVDFFKCWKYPSNSSETFKMLFFHQNNQFEAKTACFADFSILTKIAVSGPYRRGHFVSWIFWLIFWNVENTLPILLKHSKCCSFINQKIQLTKWQRR